MGYYGQYGATRDDIIQELTKGWSDPKKGVTVRVLEHSLASNVLWTVEERTEPGQPTERAIGCYLLRKGQDDFSYKPMCEQVGPYYYSVPDKFLQMVPVANAQWRADVAANKAKAKAQRTSAKALRLGDYVELVGCKIPYVRIARLKPLAGYGPDGTLYRISRSVLGAKIAAPAAALGA